MNNKFSTSNAITESIFFSDPCTFGICYVQNDINTHTHTLALTHARKEKESRRRMNKSLNRENHTKRTQATTLSITDPKYWLFQTQITTIWRRYSLFRTHSFPFSPPLASRYSHICYWFHTMRSVRIITTTTILTVTYRFILISRQRDVFFQKPFCSLSLSLSSSSLGYFLTKKMQKMRFCWILPFFLFSSDYRSRFPVYKRNVRLYFFLYGVLLLLLLLLVRARRSMVNWNGRTLYWQCVRVCVYIYKYINKIAE